jgi:hypothetical protein
VQSILFTFYPEEIMKKFLSAALAALLLAASAGTAVYAADVPAGEAVKGTPTIDGKIDDLWASAPVYNIDRVKDGRDTGLKSTFSAMWDDSALYVLIIAEDSDHSFEGGASVSENLREENAFIWRCIVSSNSISAVSECVKSISHFTPNSRKIISESFFSICAHFTKSTAPSPTLR